MHFELLLTVIFNLFTVHFNLNPKVSGGANASILHHAHAAFLSINILNLGVYVCGASILNQRVLLTAAHCLSPCKGKSNKMHVYAGHSNRREGLKFDVQHFLYHKNYREDLIANDIGLVSLRSVLPLGRHLKRVSIMRKPPMKDTAMLAGWGYLDEEKEFVTDWLQQAPQKIWSLNRCRQVLFNVPDGCICGGEKIGTTFATL